jgi:hypothetical protein
MVEPDDGPEAIHATDPYWEHRHSPNGHPHRHCLICGAILRRSNPNDRCDCHLTRDYRPQCAPDAPERLLRAFQASGGHVVHPLRDVFCMAFWDVPERQWLWRQVRALRRDGHLIVAVSGRSGGYRYLGDVSRSRSGTE